MISARAWALFPMLAVLVLASPTLANDAPFDYSGYKGVQVNVQNEQDLALLKTIARDIVNIDQGIGHLDAVIAPDRMVELEKSGLAFKVISDDIGPAMTRHLHRSATRGDFDDYMTFDELNTYLANFATARPDICSIVVVGFSVENRPIRALKITGPGDSSSRPGVFYHGGIHAREWIGPPVVCYLMNHLVSNYDTDPCIAHLVNNTVIYLAPCVNPDGYIYSWTNERLWRKNRRDNGDGTWGVDLNRNWDIGFGGPGSSSDPSDLTYHGPYAFSEPETTALSTFITNHTELRAYMDYHSYSQLILWPYGYTYDLPPEPDYSAYDAVGMRMQELIQDVHGEYYEQGPTATTIYQCSGGSIDWAYSATGVFGFSIELRPDSMFPGFELPPEEILPTCEENLPAIMHLTEWASSDLAYEFPEGLPEKLVAGSDTPVTIKVVEQFGSIGYTNPSLYYRYDPTGPFKSLRMDPLGDGLYQGILPATNCTSQPEYYFSAPSASGMVCYSPFCGESSAYTADVAGSDSIIFNEPLDSDPGWTTQSQWAFGVPQGEGGEDHGNPDPTSGHTGQNVYGYNLNGDYASGLSETHLTTTAIDCSGVTGVRLSFWRWLNVEQNSYDHAYVRVSTNGTTWTTIWANGSSHIEDNSWMYQEYDISDVADNQPTVYLRWTMGVTDSSWEFSGWNIDDIQLFADICNAIKGDINGDMVVDLTDYKRFYSCLKGPDGGLQPECGIFDYDEDGDVDLADFGGFQVSFNQ